MSTWIEPLLTAAIVIGGGLGAVIVALLKAAVSELVEIKVSLNATQDQIKTLDATVATHGKTLAEHSDLHRQHLEHFSRLGIRRPPGDAAGGTA